jgi:hypothetical protein
MLENDLRAMFEWQASADQPPAQVSFPVARRRAQVHRRRRRAAAIGSPIVAAAAAVAIGLSLSVVSGVEATKPGPDSQVAPTRFNPLVPYAAFGWLPAGWREEMGWSFAAALQLEAGRAGSPQPQLFVYSVGKCALTASRLTCGTITAGAMAVTGRAPDVDGHTAYWGQEVPPFLTGLGSLSKMLAFEYRPSGWALLTYSDRDTAIRIAKGVRFGETTGIRFPLRLTGLPRRWRSVREAIFTRDGPQMVAEVLELGGPEPLNLVFGASRGPARCDSRSCQAVTINGYRVDLTDAGTGWPSALIANDADGISLAISIGGHPPLSPAAVFAHHLELLGPDPANWTTVLFSG